MRLGFMGLGVLTPARHGPFDLVKHSGTNLSTRNKKMRKRGREKEGEKEKKRMEPEDVG
jgi:hypothetical protein